MIDFEKWFADQDFYTNMRFIHGDALFAKDGDVYRVLPVQISYRAWQTARYKTKDEHIDLTQEWHQKGWNARQKEIDQLTEEFEEDKRFLSESIQSKDTQIENLKYIQKSDEMLIASQKKRVDQLKAEKEGLLKLAGQWRESSKELCRVDDKYVIGSLLSCSEQLEEALRGEHE